MNSKTKLSLVLYIIIKLKVNLFLYSFQITQNFTTVDLGDLVTEIKKAINEVESKPGLDEITRELELSALHLEAYQSRLVEPMRTNAAKMAVSNFLHFKAYQ